jgi:hypothetical protein
MLCLPGVSVKPVAPASGPKAPLAVTYAGDLIAATHVASAEPAPKTVEAADRLASGYRAPAAAQRRDPSAQATTDSHAVPVERSSDLAGWLDDLTAETAAAPASGRDPRWRFHP